MHTGNGVDPPPIAIASTTINFMDSFNCRGSLILSTGYLSRQVNQCCGLFAAIMQLLWKPLWRQNSISHQAKLHIHNVSLSLVLLYSSQTWPLSLSLTKTIDGFDSRSLGTIKQVCWQNHVTNTVLCEWTQQPPANVQKVKCRLCWFGHLLHLLPDYLTLAISHFDQSAAGWRRPRRVPTLNDLTWLGLDSDREEEAVQSHRHGHSILELVGSMSQHEN